MGNQKSKPTGTIHARTTPVSIKATSAANATDSATPALEASSVTSDQDTAAATVTDAITMTADNAPKTAHMENAENPSVDAGPTSSHAGAAQDTLATNAEAPPAPAAPATMPLEPLAPVPLEPVPEVAGTKTKMEIATEIFKQMKKGKGVTRKEIIDQFVAEAKLSKAGASTYYQLVKSKLEKK